MLAVHGEVCDDLAALTAAVPHPHLADLAARAVAGPGRQPHLAARAVAVGPWRPARSHPWEEMRKISATNSLAGLANRRAVFSNRLPCMQPPT